MAIELYYWPTPNGHKITIFLKEAGLDYKIVPVNIGAGDQFKPDFLKISPNNKMPAIVDKDPEDGGDPISVFESGAILLSHGSLIFSGVRKIAFSLQQSEVVGTQRRFAHYF